MQNFQTDLHQIFREDWQWANEQMVRFWWRIGSPSGYRDCFPDSSLLGDTESGINRLHCMTLQCWAGTAIATMTSLRHRPLAEVCTIPVLLVCNVFEISELCVRSRKFSYLTCIWHSHSPIWCAHIGIQKARVLGYHVALFL